MKEMRPQKRILFWGISGILVGFGWVGAWTIGLPFLLVGTVMTLYGMVKIGPRGFWAALVGFGAIPAYFMLSSYFLSDRCLPSEGMMLTPNGSVTSLSCSYIPDSYFSTGLGFGIIALVGIACGLVDMWRGSAANTSQIR